jgi:hypothetical protein
MKKVVIPVVLSSSLIALTASAGLSGIKKLTSVDVETISVGNGTTTYLQFQDSPGGRSCGAGAPQVVAKGSADHVKAMTSVATAAFLAGKSVQVSFDGTCVTSSGAACSSTTSAGCYANFTGITMQ